jgi:hypothetical protein
MRKLSIKAMEAVVGGYCPPHGVPFTMYDEKESFWDKVGDFLGGFFNDVVSGAADAMEDMFEAIQSGEVTVRGHITRSDGTSTGVCFDRSGDVIANNDGNPLLRCESASGSVSFRWGFGN